jgi:hypothetical protein
MGLEKALLVVASVILAIGLGVGFLVAKLFF